MWWPRYRGGPSPAPDPAVRVRIGTTGPDAHAAEALLRARGAGIVDDPDAPVDMLVVDEWTAETATHVIAARTAGAAVSVLAELILADAPRPLVGVTGTAGKTSTCRALEAILRACARPVAISTTARSANAWPDHSLADQLGAGVPHGCVVIAELTSTHLCHMTHVHPDVAVVTTIRPDHLELHGGYRAYVAAKRRLVAELTDADAVVLPTDDPTTLDALGAVNGRLWGFGDAPTGLGAFAVPGGVLLRAPDGQCDAPTDLEGPPLRALLAAAAAALALGLTAAECADAVAHVPIVDHRQAQRPGPRGITIVDDSMAATPLKTHAALERFIGPGLVVVLGGDDALGGEPVHSGAEEQAALREALALVRESAAVVVAFGPVRDRIATHIACDSSCAEIDEALTLAIRSCPDGGTVLVSPMFPLTPAQRERAATFG